jgi:hypothetical protein
VVSNASLVQIATKDRKDHKENKMSKSDGHR